MRYFPGLAICSSTLCVGGNIITLPSGTGTLCTLDDAQTLVNKSMSDSTTFLIDEGDATKRAKFQVSGITTATTREITVPDADGTLCYTALTQTLTNKTLTTPVIASFHTDAGKANTISIPDATDTLVTLTAAQALTNKTLTLPVIASFHTDAGKTHTISIPDSTDTLVNLTSQQNLTNKTLDDVRFGVTNVTSGTTAGSHNVIRCSGLSAECKITLPDCKTNAGICYTIIRCDPTYNVVVERAGSDTVGDASTTSITIGQNYGVVRLISGGDTVWHSL